MIPVLSLPRERIEMGKTSNTEPSPTFRIGKAIGQPFVDGTSVMRELLLSAGDLTWIIR